MMGIYIGCVLLGFLVIGIAQICDILKEIRDELRKR